MWRATLKGLLAHKVRLMLTALAVILGVGFVSGTYILTDSINHAFDGLFGEINHGVAVEVQGVAKFTASGPDQNSSTAQRVPASVLDDVRAVPGVRVAEGTLSGYAQLVDRHGKAVSTGGAPTFGTSWVSDPSLSAVRILKGRAPSGEGEVAIDAGTAEKFGFAVGQPVTVLVQGPAIKATIVGIFRFGTTNNLLGATLVAFDPQQAQTALNAGGQYDAVSVAADPGVSPSVLRDRIQPILPKGFEARTGAEQAKVSSEDIKKNLSFLTISLLVFAGIALFVGVFIIFNTFSILIAQRTRELALFRALGASGAQVRRSVLLEALIFGVVASALGVGFGFVVALGLHGAFSLIGATLPSGALQVLPRTIIVSMIVGVATTLAASLVPAFRAARVPPMAALRDPEPGAYRPSAVRSILGVLLGGAGVAALLLGLFGHVSNAGLLVGLGAALVFFGVTVLSPLAARPVARALGAPLRGVAGRLGRENAMRNPKRTSSTAAALMIGLAMVGFVAIFASSIKASARQILEQTLKADYIVTSTQFTGFSQDVAGQLRANPAFGAVSQFRQGQFGYRGKSQGVQGVDPATLAAVTDVQMSAGSVPALGDSDVLVYSKTATADHIRVGDSIPVTFASTGTQRLKVVGTYDENRLLGNFVVSLPTFDRNFVLHLDQVVLVKTAPGTTQAQAKAAVDAVSKRFPNVQVQNQAQFRETQASAIDRLLLLFIILLVFSIFIAVLGIMNTLFLSIFERTREIGLLRAVGMARRQVRSMVRWEAVIVAVFGALLGTVVGVFFGWAMVQALHSSGITVLSIPIVLLVVFVVAAGLAGLAAAYFPARRAAKLPVLEAIATE